MDRNQEREKVQSRNGKPLTKAQRLLIGELYENLDEPKSFSHHNMHKVNVARALEKRGLAKRLSEGRWTLTRKGEQCHELS